MTASPPPLASTGGPCSFDPTGISATVGPLPRSAELARLWLDVEACAEGSFFTSWTWIGAWIDMAAAAGVAGELCLLTLRDRQSIVGLGILGRGQRKWGRRGFFLHQTGHAALDSIYIEYNDFLLAARCATAARISGLRALGATSAFRQSGFRMNAAPAVMAEAVAIAGLSHRVFRTEVCSTVDLERIVPGGNEAKEPIPIDDFLSTLGRNTRQQIRRALRLAEADGPLHVFRALDGASAKHMLSTLIALHTAAWTSRKGLPGAFANADFVRFAERLATTGAETGAVDLLRIGTPTQTLGVLLNFVHQGEVYAYQSGFAYTADNRLKPGLVSHALAVAYYKARGCRRYHFMAGESRYKRALSNAQETLVWIDSRTEDLLFHAENLCQTMWRVLRHSISKLGAKPPQREL